MRGTAVVASDRGGPSEIVRAGESGLLVPPGDAAALAGAITRIVGDRALAERFGAAGRALARTELSNDVFLGRIEGLYADMTSPGSGTSLAR